MIITSNHPVSDWDQIFADSIMTVAAIDRLVHHAMIIEIEATAESFRKKQAMKRNQHLSGQVAMSGATNEQEKEV
jgi:DNA replication protein DnaC